VCSEVRFFPRDLVSWRAGASQTLRLHNVHYSTYPTTCETWTKSSQDRRRTNREPLLTRTTTNKMTIVKRFVLHGPRPPGTASNAPISHGERQQAEPPTSILKKPSDKPEIELAQSPGNPKKRKRVRFESPPGEPTGTREGFSEFQRLRAAEANAAATRTSGPQLTIGSMQRIQSHSDDGNIVAVERESPADQVSDDKSDDGSPLSDLEQLGSQLNTQSHSSTANRPWARKGKEPAKAAILVRDEDVEMSDAVSVWHGILKSGGTDYGCRKKQRRRWTRATLITTSTSPLTRR